MLRSDQFEECLSKFGLSYHVYYAKTCQDLVGFENLDVLEVGGSLPPDFVFDYLGVKSWTAIEAPSYAESLEEASGLTHQGTIIPTLKNAQELRFKNRQTEKYNFYLENIEDLPEEYFGQFDIIFSIATFEHINKLPAALDKMFRALRSGGKLFSMFSPIWSAYDGHHLPEIVDLSGKRFDFGSSPIPPWGHLLMTRGEMAQYLYDKTDRETADKIVYFVYQSDHINRYFTEDYQDIIQNSDFQTLRFDLTFQTNIFPEVERQLQLIYPRQKHFSNNGILLVLEKSAVSLPSQHISSVGSYQAMNKNAVTSNVIHLKPQTSVNYPPFKNGLYMEEYFSSYWGNIDFPEMDRFVYLDVFWHNLFQNAGGNVIGVMQNLTPLVLRRCEEARQEGKLVFTLLQWDDGLLLQADKPDNLVVFAIAGNSDPDLYVPLPLIVEDRENRLLRVTRLPLAERNILCSFVGTITHEVRLRMYESLQDVEGFQFHIKSSWSADVPEDMAQKFIDVSQSSRFGLAPRGYGPSSFRFFELMQLGVIPVYVHDHENGLPYTDVLDYSKFGVIIHIDEIQNLPDILNKISDEQYEQMLKEMDEVHHWFTPEGICEYVQQYMTDILYCQDLSTEY